MTTREVALRALTRSTRWVVLDVETTNSDDGKHVLSVGITQWRQDPTANQAVPAPVEWFVDPGCAIENTRIHGITAQLLAEKKAQEFAFYIPRLTKILTARRGEKVVLVAHYARFDAGVLHLEYARANATLPDVPVLDTWALANWLNIAGRKRSLRALLNNYGLTLTKHHDAADTAADTAELLRRLLGDAATQGVTKLDAPHPANSKDAVLRRTGDYDAAPPNRGARAGSRSPFTFIERPIEHEKTHKSLPKSPSNNALDHWLADARTCIELRCPGLHHKVDGLRVDREQMAEQFMADWKAHHRDGENVSANAALGAAFVLLPKVTAAADAASWLTTWESQLVSSTRCAPTLRTDGSPTDACPDCRADRSCPGDTWPTLAAILVLGAGRNFNHRNSKTWLDTNGRLTDLVKAGHVTYATEAAWQLYEMLSNLTPELAQGMADLADTLDLVHPRLVHVQARKTELGGDPDAAIALIDAALTKKGTSSDRGWPDLLSYRDAVAARKVALSRIPTEPPKHREGHSAPLNRPDRRRFTLTAPSAGGFVTPGASPPAPTTPAPRARARKRRAARAGR